MTTPKSEIPSHSSEPSQAVPVDAILPPVPLDAIDPAIGADRKPAHGLINTFFHPASGVIILGIDTLGFATDLLTDLLGLPVVCVVSFLLTLVGVFFIQIKFSNDSKGAALGKALLGAFLAGLPFQITGMLLGAAVIALAGLPSPKQMATSFIKSEFTKPKLPEN